MFDPLTTYLFEQKKLWLPHVGIFKLIEKNAESDFINESIASPGLQVAFEAEDSSSDPINNDGLFIWLAQNMNVSQSEASELFENFSKEIETKLNDGEVIDWQGLGQLKKTNADIFFTPSSSVLSPFSEVTAKKIIREHGNHATLVGDKETTTEQMRVQLQTTETEKKPRTTAMWILLAASLICAAWYFSQSGCNKSATGNRQKVESTTPDDTYKLR